MGCVIAAFVTLVSDQKEAHKICFFLSLKYFEFRICKWEKIYLQGIPRVFPLLLTFEIEVKSFKMYLRFLWKKVFFSYSLFQVVSHSLRVVKKISFPPWQALYLNFHSQQPPSSGTLLEREWKEEFSAKWLHPVTVQKILTGRHVETVMASTSQFEVENRWKVYFYSWVVPD